MEADGRKRDIIGSVLPVLLFQPLGQVLSDFHGETVIVQLVDLLQELGVQLLKLEPL